MFTARYALSPYIKQIRFVFKGLKRKTHIIPHYTTLQLSFSRCLRAAPTPVFPAPSRHNPTLFSLAWSGHFHMRDL
jgi:hypothetical protein